MEQRNDLSKLLNMMIQPGFCVEDGRITQLNPAAQGLLLTAGAEIAPMLATGQEEYAQFGDGCLYLQLLIGDQPRGASVVAVDGCHVFSLDPEWEGSQLNAYALASRTLRRPMGSVMAAAEGLAQAAENAGDEDALEQAGRLNRGLHQMMRLINNMSDALLYTQVCQQQLVDLTGVFGEIFEKAQTMLAQAGLELRYEGPREELCALADQEQLERAVLNLLSNAAIFAPKGPMEASLTRRGSLLRLSITDHGVGIPEEILPGIFHRYLRSPCIEDGRFGIGLGLALVRTAAANHGGTVLIDRPEGGTRITMTMALRRSSQKKLSSPILDMDYAAGWDHALVELSQVLPSSLYEKGK